MENKRIIFWNVDTQNDFMNKTGPLYVPDAELIKPTLRDITLYAKSHLYPIIFTGDWHNENSKEISEAPDFKSTFPKHCIKNTPGAEFIHETWPSNAYRISWEDDLDIIDIEGITRAQNIVIYKDAFNVFEGNKKTEWVLKELDPKYVVVYGVAGNKCVDQAINGLLERNYRVLAVTDAIKSLPGCSQEELFEQWKSKGVQLIDKRFLMTSGLETRLRRL